MKHIFPILLIILSLTACDQSKPKGSPAEAKTKTESRARGGVLSEVATSADTRRKFRPKNVKFRHDWPSIAGTDRQDRSFKAWDWSRTDFGPLLEYDHPALEKGYVYEITESEYQSIAEIAALQASGASAE